MKLVKVSSTQPEIINGCEYFHFNEFGELVNWKEHVACFVSEEDARKTLMECEIDKLSIDTMEFKEFEYIPPLPPIGDEPKTVIPNYAIYCEGMGNTTSGENVGVGFKMLHNTLTKLQESVLELEEVFNDDK